MGLFKGRGKKHTKVQKWTAGFEVFENKPTVVQATFIETPKSFMLLEENSRNYREFRRLACNRVLFRKDKEYDMGFLHNTPEQAMSHFIECQKAEVKKAESRLRVAQECLDEIQTTEPKVVECTA